MAISSTLLSLSSEELSTVLHHAKEIQSLTELISVSETAILALEPLQSTSMSDWVDIQKSAIMNALDQYKQKRAALIELYGTVLSDSDESALDLKKLVESKEDLATELYGLLVNGEGPLKLLSDSNIKEIHAKLEDYVKLNGVLAIVSATHPAEIEFLKQPEVLTAYAKSGNFKLEMEVSDLKLPDCFVELTSTSNSAKQLFHEFVATLLSFNAKYVKDYLMSSKSTLFHVSDGQLVVNYSTSVDSYNRVLYHLCKIAGLPVLKLVKSFEDY